MVLFLLQCKGGDSGEHSLSLNISDDGYASFLPYSCVLMFFRCIFSVSIVFQKYSVLPFTVAGIVRCGFVSGENEVGRAIRW